MHRTRNLSIFTKTAYVVPIVKVSSPKSLGDFRPISLLCVFSKMFEKIIETNMTKFVNKNNILTPSQFGFRENSSTDLAITTFYDKLLNNINDGKFTCSIFLDLKKAFGSIDITILLKKLRHYGFEALHSIYCCPILQGVKSARKWGATYPNCVR